MTTGDRPPEDGPARGSLIERRVRKIAHARSVTLGLALTFVALAFGGAVVIRLADPDNFPSLGLAVWWALQTITTVGYGDVVPTTNFGRVVGGLEMVTGVSFIAFLTAGVTSTVIQRQQVGRQETDQSLRDRDTKTIVDAIGELDKRLDKIESKMPS
jgi:voltage-gated potassium channel